MVNLSDPSPPKANDDQGWADLNDQPAGFGHKEDCEWLTNRAYQMKDAYKQGYRE